MKMTVFQLLIAGIFLVFSGCEKGNGDELVQTKISESDDWMGTTAQTYTGPEIVRLAWGSIPEQYTSNARFQELKDAGMTHHFHYWYSSATEVQKALDAAQSAGVKMIITCPELSSNTENTVRLFMNHPALAGYFVADEPGNEQSLINAGAIADKIRAIDKNHYCYLNLGPGGKTNTVGGVQFSVFLDWYLGYYKPEIVSFDNYAIKIDKESGSTVIRPDWYDNFESIMAFSKNIGKPFWAFAMSVKHLTPSRNYPEPTIDHLRLQLYSALAYGAQGVQYFTYWTPLTDNTNLNDGNEHYFKASIMPDGAKTNIYDLVKIMNEEIKNLSFVFAGSSVKWVRHKGITSQKEIIALGTELNLTPVKSVSGKGGILIALHEKGDSQYLVIVNYEFRLNRLSLLPDANVKRVLKSGAMINAEKEIFIKPGDMVVYTWKK